jgi:Tol biopolymer transport system component
MTSPLFGGRLGRAADGILARRPGVEFEPGPGNDLVLGTRRSDDLRGGAGSDALFGLRGDDVLQGGAGLDAAWGGGGDDTFVFSPGDLITSRSLLNGYAGLVDAVLDFHGAGTSGSGQQDVIRLEGFGAGTALEFAGTVGLGRDVQLYEVVDPTTDGADGYVLVSLANNTGNRLTAEDVVVVPDDAPQVINITQGGNGGSFDPSISADGSTVAFYSLATNLVEGETDENGGIEDIFIYDVATGETINLTQGANEGSYDPVLSADGSLVVFRSFATNLGGTGVGSGQTDIFLADVTTGELISVTDGGNDYSTRPTISADGSTVAFESASTNLIDGEADPNGQTEDIFLFDVATGETTNITEGGNGRSSSASLSADGSAVAFNSAATNLVEGETDANGEAEDVFVVDVATGQTTNVTKGADGISYDPAISGDGSRVAFTSSATNLVAGEEDANGGIVDVFLFDLATGETINVTQGANGQSYDVDLSADGSKVTFTSSATNLVAGEEDANGDVEDVFVYDVATGEITLVTQGADIKQGAYDRSFDSSLAADGSVGAFGSYAPNLVEGETDANGNTADVFIFDLA